MDYHQFHNNPSPCECNTSSHLYEPYGHVITGDLSIIPNSKLRGLIAKGPKYREPCKVDWDKNLSLLCEAVDQYALQWAKQEIVELSVLSSWKEMVKGQIEERISKLKQNFKQPTGKVLQNRKNDLILIMTPEKQDKTLELSKHWSADSTLARNEVIMKTTYPVKSVKCNKICSNY